MWHDTITDQMAQRYLEGLKQQDIDTLIMGCTHYPLLAEIIGRIMGPAVTLVDAGAEVARALKGKLTDRELLADRPCGEATLYASDRPEDFGLLAATFLGQPLSGAVRAVDIEQY